MISYTILNTRLFWKNTIPAILLRTSRNSSSQVDNKKTCLYDFHLKHEGKMVPFAGFLMPVQYGNHGISASHVHTRQHVSIFDVSHMLQTRIIGKDRIPFMESLVVADLQALNEDSGTLTVFTNDKGGIIDDLIVTKASQGYLYVVSNAGCIDKDLPYMQNKAKEFSQKGGDVAVEVIEDRGLLAVQGPGVPKVLKPLVKGNLEDLYFMRSVVTTIAGVEDCRITRCGYTGEDGVEISIPADKTAKIADTLLNSKEDDVKLAGLGARDSLRLEAGLCLYGNDIDETTTPIEAGLTWLIGKSKRTSSSAKYPGAEIILKQIKDKPTKRRVGFVSRGPPARGHTDILDVNGNKVGEVTSGCPSPTLKYNVSMGYVNANQAKVGTKLKFEIRKKLIDAEVSKMPFVPAKYYVKK